MDKIKCGHEIFDGNSHRVITRRKIIEITIIRTLRKWPLVKKSHYLKLKNREAFIYDNDWIAGMEYEKKITVKKIMKTNAIQKVKTMKMKTKIKI